MQKFFNEHSDDITAFTYLRLDDGSELCATGELGKSPLIHVWDPKTMQRLASWKGVLQNGVAALSFSPDGSKLTGAGADVYHSICVLDVKGKIKKGGKSLKGGVLAKSKGCPDPILDIAWTSDDSFSTCGVKNYGVWHYSKSEKFKKPRNSVTSKLKDGTALLCIHYDKHNKRCLVGTKKGNL